MKQTIILLIALSAIVSAQGQSSFDSFTVIKSGIVFEQAYTGWDSNTVFFSGDQDIRNLIDSGQMRIVGDTMKIIRRMAHRIDSLQHRISLIRAAAYNTFLEIANRGPDNAADIKRISAALHAYNLAAYSQLPAKNKNTLAPSHNKKQNQ